MAIDFILLPIVNVIEKKDRKGNSSFTYEIAYASDLGEQCSILFAYIKGIHSSKLLEFPLSIQADTSWSILIKDIETDPNLTSIYSNRLLIGLFTHEAISGRHLDRIVFGNSCISRLLLGTDAQWLLLNIGKDVMQKSPGNGALLQVLLGKCTDENTILLICSSLSHEVDGIYNDLLGKSTVELENNMIDDADYVRSLSDLSSSYFHLTGIDITKAYYTNYSELFRLLGRLRAGGNDYFAPILQPQVSYKGNRKRAMITDSTKLMSLYNRTIHQKVIRDNSGTALCVSRVEGGMFFMMKRDSGMVKRDEKTEEDRSILCPFGSVIKEISEIYSLFSLGNSLFTPMGLNSTKLTHLNIHEPISIRYLSDGKILPQQGNPFKKDQRHLSELPNQRDRIFEFIHTEEFIEKLKGFVSKISEYNFACKLSMLLRGNSNLSIFDLFTNPSNAILHQRGTTKLNTSTAEEKIARLFINIVVNASVKERNSRQEIFTNENILIIANEAKGEILPIDKVNAFILCSDWTMLSTVNVSETFYMHLALSASLLYAKNGTKVLGKGGRITFTESVWPNFGVVPHITQKNGDVLIRTLNGSLSQRSNALSMILASKNWSFVVGNLPKAEKSIKTEQTWEVKIYSRGNEVGQKIEGEAKKVIGDLSFRNSTFIELFRKTVSLSREIDLRLKPERRKLMMPLLLKEWKSLIQLPLTKRPNTFENINFFDIFDLLNVGLKDSFVVSGNKYSTRENRLKVTEEFLSGLARNKNDSKNTPI